MSVKCWHRCLEREIFLSLSLSFFSCWHQCLERESVSFFCLFFFFSFFLNLGEREKEREGGRGSDSPCVWERKWKSPNCNSPCVNERESGRVQIAILCQWKREWKSPNSHGFGSVHLNSLGEFSMFLCWLKCLPTVGNCWPREMFMTGYPVTTRIHLKNSLLDNFNKSRSTKFLESNIFLFAQGVKCSVLILFFNFYQYDLHWFRKHFFVCHKERWMRKKNICKLLFVSCDVFQDRLRTVLT